MMLAVSGAQMDGSLPIEVCRPSSYQLERCRRYKRDQNGVTISSGWSEMADHTRHTAVHVCGQGEADGIMRDRSSQKFAQLVQHWQSFGVSTLQGNRPSHWTTERDGQALNRP